ncbi:beta-N-acetylglucosaminidase domain-containing protein [Streptomyces sp. MUM 203J]|uniref:beta-N-acetylglucosaminidase domain-containing protein n=1 Tax=Streptomyces sp. MUM 203J TaxID=2791990 RepID=UPI001F045B91|nr:beta-N-acetylglucosaminidase domain-containing protein [Streptomyces sp. MUM 203J]MCH0541192.1 beta-N-acetylglucosaminidase domain-containing protein [Streptomyces sp. MUM 203J]
MQLAQFGRGRRTATAIAVAVIGGLLGGAPGVLAAPGDPSDPSAPTSARPGQDAEAGTPPVWPRPQSMRSVPEAAVRLGDTVSVVAAPDAHPYALTSLEEALRAAGVREVRRDGGLVDGGSGPGAVVLMGGTGAQAALRALRAPERGDLPTGGYRLATGRYEGRDVIAVDGTGRDGLFHAVQTLRQLITGERLVPGVQVRDWPGTAVRGLTEGFYGRPWSHQQRLAQLDFMARTKQNRYMYAPGDDPYRQARWREPYPAPQRAAFRELAERAKRAHITLAWAIAPAQSMCLASPDDMRALKRKIDAMYALGVRAFQIQFQDASYDEWHCAQDVDTYGRGPEAAATAHARAASELARHLAERYPDAEPLSLMPTEYYQDGATDYRTALAGALDARVQVAWTGVGVVPRTITGRELRGAREAFAHRPLVTMDNYPVNDYAQDRIFLGPYTGREPAVAAGSAALLANAMEQASASRIPLFTAADYAWNPRGYRPGESWEAALDDLADGDPKARAALKALAGNAASSLLDQHGESAYLRPVLDAFWRTRTTAGVPAAVRDRAAAELRAAFTVMREAPDALAGTAEGRLDDEVRPWLEQLSRYGRAGETAVDMLQAQAHGDGAAAWRAQLSLEPQRTALRAGQATVGKDVLDAFLDRAGKESAAWTGTARKTGGEAHRSGDAYTLELGRTRVVEAVTVLAEPDSGGGTGAGAGAGSGGSAGGAVEVRVPGEGWRPVGALSPSGFTQVPVGRVRADALRVVREGGGRAVPVRALAPWFADEPVAVLELRQGEVDAEIGGAAQRVDAVVAARRPSAVRGALTARAPEGVRVEVPKETTVPRGTATSIPVTVTVPEGTEAGAYQVPLTFAGERRVLTVRAFPKTGGPDLARTGSASSSGDETPDFPAGAALDGDAETRWSSPPEETAWWQVELARPARVGQVVLHWQEAYATRYRVQVSTDGRVWRTAATVRDGRGGRESVRLDATARYVRVQLDKRATEYGYSLYAAEVFAVLP